MTRRVVLVVGPPASGKSTWVQERAADSDVVVDFDTIAQNLGSPSAHDHDGEIVTRAAEEQRRIEGDVAEMTEGTAYVIRAEPDPVRRQEIAQRVGATEVEIVDPGAATVLARLGDRPDRSHRAVADWYRLNNGPADGAGSTRHGPSPSDTEEQDMPPTQKTTRTAAGAAAQSMEQEAPAEAKPATGADGAAAGTGESSTDEKGFPADTPLAEMTVEQREAYWKDKARKHEQRAKAEDRVDRADYDRVVQELADAKQATESEQETALRLAREEGATEALTGAKQDVVGAMARMALRARGVKDEDINSFVTETNLSAFVADDGQVDDERLLARVDRYAGTANSTEQWPDTGRRGGGDGRPERRSGKELRSTYLRS